MTNQRYVKLIYAPLSDRMWSKNQQALIDTDNNKIRIGENWFDFDDRYKVEQNERLPEKVRECECKGMSDKVKCNFKCYDH